MRWFDARKTLGTVCRNNQAEAWFINRKGQGLTFLRTAPSRISRRYPKLKEEFVHEAR